MKEIGLDLDVVSIRKLCRILSSIKYIHQNPDVPIPKEVKLYRTKKGYHVICYFDKEISILDSFIFRSFFDDPYRVKFSLQRVILDPDGIDVTFDVKETIYPKTEPFKRKDISDIFNLVTENIDETEKKIKDKYTLETVCKYITVIPISKDEIEPITEQLAKNNIREWRIQFAMAEKEQFYITFGGNDTVNQAFSKGMRFKKDLNIITKRKTFWIKTASFELIGESK